jgi:predicted transcriptional regulator
MERKTKVAKSFRLDPDEYYKRLKRLARRYNRTEANMIEVALAFYEKYHQEHRGMNYSEIENRLADLGFRPDEIEIITRWWDWREHYDWLMTASKSEIMDASREAFGEG